MSVVDTLLAKHDLISEQVNASELRAILRELEWALAKQGSVVEFGCYSGTTSLFIRRMMNELNNQREYHVYDSFVGLPRKRSEDISPLGEQFKAGELAISKKEFIQNFKRANLKLPTIHKGWFNELTQDNVPGEICFAFLDGDYYESVKTPLLLITPKLMESAVIVVDDYGNEALPGARKAVDEWRRSNDFTIREEASLAILRR